MDFRNSRGNWETGKQMEDVLWSITLVFDNLNLIISSQAPLGGKISEGNITWEGQGELEVKNICFEWIGSSKFPYDCQVHRNQFVSCRKNTFYPDKKCPTKGIAPPTAGHTLLRKIVVDLIKLANICRMTMLSVALRPIPQFRRGFI